MELAARLAVVALVALPLVVLVVRSPHRVRAAGTGVAGRWDGTTVAHDEPAAPGRDADARRLRTELAALATRREAAPPPQPTPTHQPTAPHQPTRPPQPAPPPQPEAPSRFSAEIAS